MDYGKWRRHAGWRQEVGRRRSERCDREHARRDVADQVPLERAVSSGVVSARREAGAFAGGVGRWGHGADPIR